MTPPDVTTYQQPPPDDEELWATLPQTAAPEAQEDSAEESELLPSLRLLPPDFWEARPVLRHIRQAAHARNRSGDVVFGGTLTRTAALLPPTLTADTGVATPASMNMIAGLLGGSGKGKSTGAMWIPGKLVSVPPGLDFMDGLPLGSGEGLAEAYMGEKKQDTGRTGAGGKPTKKEIRTKVRSNALLYADEGESLINHMFGRNGATIGASMRSVFSGATFGQFNGRKETTRVIQGGTYSMGIVVGFQPKYALRLIEDADAGTPQRFLWFATTDPTIPADGIDDPNPYKLSLTCFEALSGKDRFRFAGEVLKRIKRDDWEVQTGKIDPPLLDSHKPLIKVKLACLLAILDNRLDVTVEDWQLADVVWTTSCRVRDWIIEQGERQRAKETEAWNRKHVDRAVRVHAATIGVEHDIERVARKVGHHIHAANGMNRGELRKKIAYRDREKYFDPAIDRAEEYGWVTTEGDDKILPGPSRPS